MQSVFEGLFASRSFIFAAMALAGAAATLLFIGLFRRLSGGRVKPPGNGRQRQPRLGIVDAFDLDRQRQLVIVRRDNVEHLLMIGGPNDLVIEPQIIRGESREWRPGREARLRERDARETAAQLPPREPEEQLGSASLRAAAAAAPNPASDAAPEVPRSGGRVVRPLAPQPVRTPSVASAPPVRAQPQLQNLKRPPAGESPRGQGAALKSGSGPAAAESKPIPAAFANSVFLRPPVQRPGQSAGARGAHAPAPAKALAEEVQPALSQASETRPGGETGTVISLDSPPSAGGTPVQQSPEPRPAPSAAAGPVTTLEEDMARLLGRGPG